MAEFTQGVRYLIAGDMFTIDRLYPCFKPNSHRPAITFVIDFSTDCMFESYLRQIPIVHNGLAAFFPSPQALFMPIYGVKSFAITKEILSRQEKMEKLIITVAPTGSLPTKK